MSSITAAGKAFDRIARDYDQMFTYSLIGRAQRNVVWRALARTVRRGDRVLDMNCGTGEDALYLSTLGAHVLAFDTAAEMINVARSKVPSDSLNIDFFQGNIESVDSVVEDRFDLILSNFSGMNCVANLADVAQKLDRLTLSSGTLLLCVSTRVCLWETLFYLSRGDLRRALRRWSGFWVPTVGVNAVPVWYPTVREIRASMRPYFSLKSVRPSASRFRRVMSNAGRENIRCSSVAWSASIARSAGCRFSVCSAITFSSNSAGATHERTAVSPFFSPTRSATRVSGLSSAARRHSGSQVQHTHRCAACGFSLQCVDGIWHALAPDRAYYYDRFIHEYEAIRAAEGRGSDSPNYYRSLPFVSLEETNGWQWQIRAISYQYFVDNVLGTLAKPCQRVLDLGAGNGWLSYRLASTDIAPSQSIYWSIIPTGSAPPAITSMYFPTCSRAFAQNSIGCHFPITSLTSPSSTLHSITPKIMCGLSAKPCDAFVVGAK